MQGFVGFCAVNSVDVCSSAFTDMLKETRKSEKEAGIEVDNNVNAFCKAAVLQGRRGSVMTEYVIQMLGLGICADTIIGEWLRYFATSVFPLFSLSCGGLGGRWERHKRTQTQTHTPTPSLSLSHTHTHSLSHAHTHTHM